MGSAQRKAAKERRRQIRQAKAQRRELAHQVSRLAELRGVRITSKYGGAQATMEALGHAEMLRKVGFWGRLRAVFTFWRRRKLRALPGGRP